MSDRFQLKALITGVDRLSPVLGGIRRNANNLRRQLTESGLGKIGFMEALQGGALALPFVLGAKEAMRFESAMADVKKVVNFDSPDQFKQMSKDVLNLSEQLPMAANGIAQIVAAGGQSGIAREDLSQFAQDAVKMGIAFDQTAEQSGSMMAKWRTAFKLNQEEVVTLADKINYLGNTGAASTAQISNIVTAIGPLGEIAGLNAGQLAAMGSALAGVGIAQDVAATGMKNFALTLTAGSAATKSQQMAFKALRLDANEIARGMQTDSEGTINKVLQSVAKVDKAKQAAVLTNLFGKESVGAIAPLLTNLDVLQKNFKAVGDKTKYAGSMEGEYKARSETTENALQLLQNRMTALAITVGTVLLPPFNDFMATVGPIISKVSTLADANPWLIKGLLGAAVGFGVLRVATAGTTAALGLMNAVVGMSPVGLIVRGIALAAGLLIGNWSTVAPYFEAIWKRIEKPAMAVWGWLKTAFSWTPIGMIIENWQPLTAFFGSMWELTKALSVPFMDFMASIFDWTPLGMIVNNWEPISGFFQSMWNKLKPILEPMMKLFGIGSDGPGFLESAKTTVDGWTERQKLANAGEGGGTGEFLRADAAQAQRNQNILQGATRSADLLRPPANDPVVPGGLIRAPTLQLVSSQPPPLPAPGKPLRVTGAESLPVPGNLLRQSEVEPLPNPGQLLNRTQAVRPVRPGDLLPEAEAPTVPRPGALVAMPEQREMPKPGSLLQQHKPTPPSGELVAQRGSLVQQTAANNRTSLEGAMVVRFDNAPQGMRVDPMKTNQPGLTVTPQVGYRSLAREG